ncbi:MAG: ABC transporter substrate-binding protein [Acidimicrobiia bacterium]|nr:ABC transporter substrate-binding protein [Acidimicrobiia bacterium]
MTRWVQLGLATLIALASSAACGDGADLSPDEEGPAGLRVASFDFAESELLAELYAQAIEASGVPVVRLGSVGPREIVAPAMELGHIDLVPEYLGTALEYAGSSEANPDSESARVELNQRLSPRGMTALAASPAEDKNVIVVTTETAEVEGLESISDLVPLVERQRFGGPPECPDRPLCLVGLEGVYGLRFAEFVAQRSLAITAEALRRGEIDVGLMFSTASELEASDLVELRDDRELQPAENVIPVMRIDAIERWGDVVKAALNAVSAELTTGELRELNARVASGDQVDVVVSDWLTDHDLLGP